MSYDGVLLRSLGNSRPRIYYDVSCDKVKLLSELLRNIFGQKHWVKIGLPIILWSQGNPIPLAVLHVGAPGQFEGHLSTRISVFHHCDKADKECTTFHLLVKAFTVGRIQ